MPAAGVTVKCVAKLIETVDAGCSLARQLKERRSAHGTDHSLKHLDRLERTIEDGRRAIQELVDEGNKRFGPDFQDGDDIARPALLRIDSQVQTLLLSRLVQAQAYNSYTSLARCIELSEGARIEALLTLHQFYQRKLRGFAPSRISVGRVESSIPQERKSPRQTSNTPHAQAIIAGSDDALPTDWTNLTSASAGGRRWRATTRLFYMGGAGGQKQDSGCLCTYCYPQSPSMTLEQTSDNASLCMFEGIDTGSISKFQRTDTASIGICQKGETASLKVVQGSDTASLTAVSIREPPPVHVIQRGKISSLDPHENSIAVLCRTPLLSAY